jgi:exodeoxyribonuclease V alpha subunit
VTEASTGDLFRTRLTGQVTRIVYEHPDSRWAVLRLEQDEGGEATVVGVLSPVFEGERLQVDGQWVEDKRFGRQFRAERAMSIRPTSAVAIERYLASGVVPGVGPSLAARLVERFGEQTLQVIDDEPARLLEVNGIGAKRLAQIKSRWSEQTAERSARVFLQGLGVGPALTDKIVRAWGNETEERIQTDPYALVSCTEISGVGFRTADKIARQLPGWEADTQARAEAGVMHALETQAGQGHCFIPLESLVEATVGLLEIDDDAVVRGALAALLKRRHLVADQITEDEAWDSGIAPSEDGSVSDAIYIASYHGAEVRVARRLAAIATEPAEEGLPGNLPLEQRQRAVSRTEQELGVDLADEQRQALQATLSEKLLLVTGGPGTGKTSLIDAVVRCGMALGAEIALAAPTGRAAKRLREATGHESKTLHRLLEYQPRTGAFARNFSNPLEADLVVVDEASMIDLFLMDALVGAVPPEAVLVLVGDADQLPPVGPGAVLRDLLASGRIHTVRLTRIFRQARDSLIIQNAHRINAGKMPQGLGRSEDWPDEEERDFYFIEEEQANRALDVVLKLVAERIPARFGTDARRDIQVVAPMYRGNAGVNRLNESLQQTLNPQGRGRKIGETTLREGDRVIQLRNDYDREVFNGDIGSVLSAPAEADLVVDFDGRRVDYDADACRDLALAYAITVHKSQGSEYPAVVVVLLPEHHIMLQRNLIYTALTRGKDLVVLVGSRRAVGRAVGNAKPMRRCTRLTARFDAALDHAVR